MGLRRPPRLWQRLGDLVRLRKVLLLRAEIRLAPTEAQRLFALTIVIGSLCGLAAVAFHLSIKVLEQLLVERSGAEPGNLWIVWSVLTPTLGAALCGALLHYVVPEARGSGVPQVKVAFATDKPVRTRHAIGKFLICALQLGTGSSLGREGPTVQICAGIASSAGRVAGISPKSLRRLLPVGAAAGIAAAFNAPIAAVTFTIEEIVGKLDQAVLSGVIIAAAIAAVIERSVLGGHPIFELPQSYGLRDVSSLLVYALIGIASAVVSVLFCDLLLWQRLRFRRSKLPPWARPAIGGLVTGVLAVVAWTWLHSHGVTGGGYTALGNALDGQLTLKVMLALCAMKIVATATAYSSGGAGGLFAPTLFIGGTLGGAIGHLDHVLLHHDAPLGAFALVGMGAAFSGTIRAPITSVLIIIEMTNGYSLILPLMLANMTAYVLARHWRPEPIYDALLAQDGIHLDHPAGAGIEERRLRGLVRQSDASSLEVGTNGTTLTAVVHRLPNREVHPVVRGDGTLVGVITKSELEVLDAEPELLPLVTAADLVRPGVEVNIDQTLGAALEAMIASGLTVLPVVDEAGKFLGVVSEADIAKAYLQDQRVKKTP